jgi:hypothetical protein
VLQTDVQHVQNSVIHNGHYICSNAGLLSASWRPSRSTSGWTDDQARANAFSAIQSTGQIRSHLPSRHSSSCAALPHFPPSTTRDYCSQRFYDLYQVAAQSVKLLRFQYTRSRPRWREKRCTLAPAYRTTTASTHYRPLAPAPKHTTREQHACLRNGGARGYIAVC